MMKAMATAGRLFRIAGVILLVVSALGLMAAGPIHTGIARAQSLDDRLQIALDTGSGPGPWGKEADGFWVTDGLLPGEQVAGSLYLRTVNMPSGYVGALYLFAEIGDGASAEAAAALEIVDLRLGGTDLLPGVRATCGLQFINFPALNSCQPELPLPSGAGDRFTMTLALDEQAGNVLQGARFPFRLFVALEGDAYTGPEPTATPTPPGASGTPTPPGGGTPTASPPASSDDPVDGITTPGAPSAGLGTSGSSSRSLHGIALLGAALLSLGCVLWFIPGSRREER
jgi:hypothetical protein